MVDQYRAPRQWGCPRTGGQHRLALVLLGLILLFVSAGAGVGLMPLRSPFFLVSVATATTPQSVQMHPDLRQTELVVNTPHPVTLQVIDAAGNPVPQAGIPLRLEIIPPEPRRADSLPPSVTPTELTTDANGQAAAVLTVGHTSGSFPLLVGGGAVAVFFDLTALPDRASARLVEVSGNIREGMPGEELDDPLVVQLEDQFGNPIEGEPVTFTRLVGDGEFVDVNAVTSKSHTRGPTERLGLARPRQTVPPVVSVTVSTDREE